MNNQQETSRERGAVRAQPEGDWPLRAAWGERESGGGDPQCANGAQRFDGRPGHFPGESERTGKTSHTGTGAVRVGAAGGGRGLSLC